MTTSGQGRTVLVTGCSTGIGRACALLLDRSGWRVFAGVRKERDADDISGEASAHLTPVLIDVSDAQSIDLARKTLEEAGSLHALVNNAGISVNGPLEYVPVDDLRRQFEVNVVGQIAVTQALLPLLRSGQGRIVFIGSVAGRTPSLPFFGPYSASKWALEALVDSLRLELKPSGVTVSLVEPGSIATAIWEKGYSDLDDLLESMPPEGRAAYSQVMERGKRVAQFTESRGIPPEKVAQRVQHVLTTRSPRARYLVGVDAHARAYVESLLPDRVRDRVVGRVLGY